MKRAKLVPASAIDEMQQDGAGFAGFATWLDMTPADPDMFAMPDPATLIQLPWKPEVGWVAADLWMDGKPVEQAPARRPEAPDRRAAAEHGYEMKTGRRVRVFPDRAGRLSDLRRRRHARPSPATTSQALMRRYDVIAEICDAMLALGWAPYQNDHEDANGQFEMNWDYDDALITADRHAFFKYMVKSIAEKHGLRATFMPKPFADLTGNGCHAHVSLWGKAGKNLFDDRKGELGLSPLGLSFHRRRHAFAPRRCAPSPTRPSIPTSGSTRRAPLSGATWSPNTVTYAGNNRTHMIRIPDAGRFELRLPTAPPTPISCRRRCSPPGSTASATSAIRASVSTSTCTPRANAAGAKTLPLNLLDAIRATQKSRMLRTALGAELIDSYAKLKLRQWDVYSAQISPWERDQTLDC